MIGYSEIKTQSQAVVNQFFESKWIPYTKENLKLPHKPASEFLNIGLGKVLVCSAFGPSLEKDIDILKANRDKFDLICCDKAFSPLLDRGVKADYVLLADCNIPYHWIEKNIEETKGVKLISTIYANPEWTSNWKGDRYFFMNMDILNTEHEFIKRFPELATMRQIPAGSNVSNAIITFMIGCDHKNRFIYSGYEKFLLIGYDFCWYKDGNYYAWNNPKPKRNYMTHRITLDLHNNICFTSENLHFSAKWLSTYIQAFKLPIYNCTGGGILAIPTNMDFQTAISKINKSDFNLIKRIYQSLVDMKKSNDYLYQSFNQLREGIWQ